MSLLVCHPLDTVRVRLQTTSASRFTGPLDVVRQTAQREGLLGFYKGMATPLLSQALQKATMFFAFGGAKRQLGPLLLGPPAQPALPPALPPLPFVALCGGIAGGANALVAAPIELVRNRLQVQYHRAGERGAAVRYAGPVDVVRQTLRTAGARGLWTGMLPMLYRDVPGVAAWYTGFEGSRRLLTAGQQPETVQTWKLMLAGACGQLRSRAVTEQQRLCSALLLISVSLRPLSPLSSSRCLCSGGIGFWTFGFPQDLIKSVIQTQAMHTVTQTQPSAAAVLPSSPAALSFFSTARQLVAAEGASRLWRGFPIALLRGIPGAAITFTTYTTVMSGMAQRGW